LAAIVYVLSLRLLGGIYRMPILIILFSFISFYLADFLFAYTTTVGTYFVGMWVDVFYPTAFLFIGTGLALLDSKTRDETIARSTQALSSLGEIASKIIKEQERVIGPLAWSEARKVSGVRIDPAGTLHISETDGKIVIDRLVAQ